LARKAIEFGEKRKINVITPFDRRTDGRTDRWTDRILIARQRLYFMHRGTIKIKRDCMKNEQQ